MGMSEDGNQDSESIEQQNAGRLEPVAQVPIPDGWEFDVRAGPDSGEAEFEYQRSTHPEFESKRLNEDNSIKIYNSGRTYEVVVEILGKDIWTDDVWRVTNLLDECYYCALGEFGQHEGECKTLFELVQDEIENERLYNLLIDIDNVGEKLATEICERFDSVYDLNAATEDELIQIDYVGPKIAERARAVAEHDTNE